MIYGLNFGAPDIPAHLRYKPRIVRPVQYPDKVVHERMCLVGVCQTPREMLLMERQADNGHRRLYWVHPARPKRLAGYNFLYVY